MQPSPPFSLHAATHQPWLRLECDERIGPHPAQHNLELSADWVSVFGPSGSGKTTLLRLLAGLVPQHSGTCLIHGRELRNVSSNQRRVALVDQAASVFPHLSVEQNVGFARTSDNRNQRDHLAQTLDHFHLAHLAQVRAHQLSGGEAQRVVIARAVFSQPDLLLLDESFSGLDRELREQLRVTLLETQAARAQQQRPMPILSVTHDVGEVFATAKEVLRMRDGRIVAQGTPAEVLSDERDSLLRRLTTG